MYMYIVQYLICKVTMTAVKMGWAPAADWLVDVVLCCYHDNEHGEDQHSVSGIQLVREGVSAPYAGVGIF